MIVMFAVFLLMLWIPKEASAAGVVNGSCGENSQYSYNTGTKVLTISGTGQVTDQSWKSYKKDIKKVVVNEGITGIGGSAFDGCTELSVVTLPKSLTSIGFYSFANCTSLKNITIPKNVTESGGNCFTNSGVTTVSFEGETTEVAYGLFADCKNLITIHFPQTIKKIGNGAFEGCTGLSAVTLPKSLTSIGFYSFARCTSLKNITIPKNATEGEGHCFDNSGVATVTFEEGMTEVKDSFFEDCKNLTTIHFPQTIKKIGDSAFAGCTGLTTVTLPWYLQEIGFYSFANCSNLKKITIYQNVKKINDYAFSNVTGLTICGKKGTKAQTFAKDKKYSFAACKVPALKGITYKKGNLKYTVVTDYINGKVTVCVTGMGKKASSVTIPNTVKLENYKYKVTKINKKAFYKKSALKKVTIKATGITKVGSNAFGKINQRAIIYVPKSKYKQYNKMLKKAGVKSPMKIKKR